MEGERMAAKTKYNWAAWFRQRRFTLIRGEHYRCSTASMIQQARNAWGGFSSSARFHLAVIRHEDGFTGLVLPFPFDHKKKRWRDARIWNSRNGNAKTA